MAGFAHTISPKTNAVNILSYQQISKHVVLYTLRITMFVISASVVYTTLCVCYILVTECVQLHVCIITEKLFRKHLHTL